MLRFHEISEAGHRILNPFTDDKLMLLGSVCRPRPGQRILDLCCGKGELLARWAAEKMQLRHKEAESYVETLVTGDVGHLRGRAIVQKILADLAAAKVPVTEAQVNAARDQIEDQVWTAYTNLYTAFRQREAATALLTAASESYSAALESYNYGVRNLLDVTNAQKVLAQARSTDILARTQVLAAVADLAFRTGDAIQSNARRIRP